MTEVSNTEPSLCGSSLQNTNNQPTINIDLVSWLQPFTVKWLLEANIVISMLVCLLDITSVQIWDHVSLILKVCNKKIIKVNFIQNYLLLHLHGNQYPTPTRCDSPAWVQICHCITYIYSGQGSDKNGEETTMLKLSLLYFVSKQIRNITSDWWSILNDLFSFLIKYKIPKQVTH